MELRGIPYEAVPVNLKTGEQKEPSFLKVNSAGLVPYLLLENGQKLSQSLAQISYIDDLEFAKGESVIPKAQYDRAKVLELWEIIAADTHPIQNLSVQFRHSSNPEERKKWCQDFISRGLRNYLAASQNCRGAFSFGDKVSLADLALIPQIYNALRFDLDVPRDFMPLWSLYETCLATSECQKSAPEQQVDAV